MGKKPLSKINSKLYPVLPIKIPKWLTEEVMLRTNKRLNKKGMDFEAFEYVIFLILFELTKMMKEETLEAIPDFIEISYVKQDIVTKLNPKDNDSTIKQILEDVRYVLLTFTKKIRTRIEDSLNKKNKEYREYRKAKKKFIRKLKIERYRQKLLKRRGS